LSYLCLIKTPWLFLAKEFFIRKKYLQGYLASL
jgi:hypothetical protein